MNAKTWLLGIWIALMSTTSLAAEPKLVIKENDSLQDVLRGQADKKIGVLLNSGVELHGVLKEVGAKVIRLQELRNRETFDAVIPLSEVSAVLIDNHLFD
ncbi:hypothetical protein [Hahella sp. NBU794]|uniref:hypothetical protein n=1 Tax=Hahella sp. NBU794 TaxID=3422590 RepID=UPI003D701B72